PSGGGGVARDDPDVGAYELGGETDVGASTAEDRRPLISVDVDGDGTVRTHLDASDLAGNQGSLDELCNVIGLCDDIHPLRAEMVGDTADGGPAGTDDDRNR